MASPIVFTPTQIPQLVEQAGKTAGNGLRSFKTSFDPEVDAVAETKLVQRLCQLDPSLKVYTPSSPQYETLRGVYNKQITARPQAIVRPTAVAQVQAVVRMASTLGVPLAVRAVGHAFFGNSCVEGSVMLDMREMDSLTLSPDSKTVKVGGGALTRNVTGFLDGHGLVVPASNCASIGWTGWALWGGYGLLNSYAGLGVDNIMSAKVVTADGNVVEADGSSDLLWGIRGAGASLGVIVETTVKTHQVPAFLGGVIQYKQDRMSRALLGLQDLLQKGVPEELCLQLELSGNAVNLIVGWVGDLEEGEKWVDIVRGIAEVEQDSVEQTTFNALQGLTSKDIPVSTHTATRGVSVLRLTPEIIDMLETSLSKKSNYTVTGLLNYGKSAQANSDSAFSQRDPHVLLFVNAIDEAANMEAAASWVNGLADQLKATDQAMQTSYASFAQPQERMFGGDFERLAGLKEHVDPHNVFRFASNLGQ